MSPLIFVAVYLLVSVQSRSIVQDVALAAAEDGLAGIKGAGGWRSEEEVFGIKGAGDWSHEENIGSGLGRTGFFDSEEADLEEFRGVQKRSEEEFRGQMEDSEEEFRGRVQASEEEFRGREKREFRGMMQNAEEEEFRGKE